MLQTLVLGIGNAWRGDDAAGLLAAHALRAHNLPGVTVVETNDVDPTFIDAWQEVDRLILVDTVMSGAAPGTVHCFDLSRETLPATFAFCSTHAFDLAALLGLARALERLPVQAWVFGIEASNFAHGQPVSEAVMLGLATCVEMIAGMLASQPPPNNERY